MDNPIYHICTKESWFAQKTSDTYTHSSLEAEGFIHCSFYNQIEGVLERYFQGVKDLLLLTIDPKLLDSDLAIEPSTADEDYPHIYGKINKVAIVDIHKLK